MNSSSSLPPLSSVYNRRARWWQPGKPGLGRSLWAMPLFVVCSIRTKVLAGLLVVMLLSASVMVYVAEATVQPAILAEHAQTAGSIVHTIETLFTDVTDLRGPLAQQRLAAIVQGRSDIERILVLAHEERGWRVIASNSGKEVNELISLDLPAEAVVAPLHLPAQRGARDHTVQGVVAPLWATGPQRLALLLETDIGPVQRTLREISRRSVSVTLLGTIGVVGILFWSLELFLVRPVRRLRWMAHELEQGRLAARSGLRRRDEIGQLASALDQTATALEEAAEEKARLYQELEQRWEEASREAITDSLTGLYNHRYLHLRLKEEHARAARQKTPLSLLLVDIDHFKAVNDAYGHPVGDQILAALASVFRTTVRLEDIVCRYGGEEFAILLPDTGTRDALAVAERIRCAVAQHPFHTPSTGELCVTVSLGAAAVPEDAMDRDGLLKLADEALYYAKRMGRNQVWAYRDIVVTSPSDGRPEWWDQLQLNAIHSLATAVDFRDSYTHDHSDEVARLATAIGRSLGLSAIALRDLLLAGTVHDVGKIGVPDRILGKDGPLTDEEWAAMKQHPEVGERILQQVRGLEHIAPVVRAHHERWDGGGYPDGLKGEDIPLLARIISVADTFHAMTSDRPYRKALSVETALTELRQKAGRQFDPAVVLAAWQVSERGELGELGLAPNTAVSKGTERVATRSTSAPEEAARLRTEPTFQLRPDALGA